MDTLSLARFDRMLTLPSGERVRLRPIRPDDEPRLSELYDRSSRDTRYQRFFTVMRRLPPDWAYFLANVDYDRRLALVAEDVTAPTTRLIGVARYEPGGDDIAEIALVVEDAWQGKGVGTRARRALSTSVSSRRCADARCERSNVFQTFGVM